MKKSSAILIIIMMCLTLCSCSRKKELKDDIYIFFTADVHCGVDENVTLSSVKALVDDAKTEHPYVALVDTGDFIQGGALGSLSKGEIIINIMNKMDYDAVAIGNHEFDYGMDQLSKLISMMEFQPVICNSVYSGSKEDIFKDLPGYVIKDFDGVKVAFVGITTPTSVTSSTPEHFKEDGEYVYDFGIDDSGEELARRVQNAVDSARKEGADYVVALSHLGSVEAYNPYDCITMICSTSGIDAVLDGHSHSLIAEDFCYNKEGKEVKICSAGTKLEAVGELIIGKDGTISTMLVTEYAGKDTTIDKAVEEANSELDQILSQEVFETDHPIRAFDDEGVRMSRNRETEAGNFVADAYRYALNTQIGFVNGGGVRADLKAGTVTYNDLLSVNPFQNELSSCYATGQNILDALEYCSRNTEAIYKLDGNPVGEAGSFLQTSGLKYTIDTSIESAVIQDENNVFAGFSSDARRVKDVYVLIDGEYEPLDPKKTYTVGASDYVLYSGGDGTTMFMECEPIISCAVTDINALIDYAQLIDDFSDRYTDVEGRIIVK
ncbi:MAG: bifunctional metallophosphatase/5'-nucleotidase [Erysipelotrichaceae bacterium]|nr:bifunctional metallophosphatase/5'-nucleotidase [Erysipelotrichaceae bacterium]